MQISDFLFPKNKVAYIVSSATMQEAMDMLEKSQYTAIPVIDEEGKYVGTLSEGDLFWKMKHTSGLTFQNLDTVKVYEIKRRIHNECVSVKADLDDMLHLAADQNFVPVVETSKSLSELSVAKTSLSTTPAISPIDGSSSADFKKTSSRSAKKSRPH
ncbi:inosine-5-monophosphate dehydrogenase [Gordoniibacillus kamchatkensis]|uniref:Inosine-5-monophosphate dehydrogenase n=1 Tax=Gordoniibacillus kamchatkensis TaxID=1590651 RepID=A0ABR5AIB0_9BACL|nr:inosine-5-monophosphate dehydrogenase [Paenibacillus sp. VKM B-2647]